MKLKYKLDHQFLDLAIGKRKRLVSYLSQIEGWLIEQRFYEVQQVLVYKIIVYCEKQHVAIGKYIGVGPILKGPHILLYQSFEERVLRGQERDHKGRLHFVLTDEFRKSYCFNLYVLELQSPQSVLGKGFIHHL